MNEFESPRQLRHDDESLGAAINALIASGVPPAEAEAAIRGDGLTTPPPTSPEDAPVASEQYGTHLADSDSDPENNQAA